MSGRESDGTGAPDPPETAETATATPLARREVLKGLAGAGAIAGGITGVGRDVESGAGLVDAVSALDGVTETLSVSTLDPSSVDQTGATLEGELLALGGASEAEVFFEYWQDGSTDRSETARQTQTSPGTWSAPVTGLEAGTDHRYRAVAETGEETVTGEEVTVTTQEELAVETAGAAEVGRFEATLRADLTSLGGAGSVDVFFRYGGEGASERRESGPVTREATGTVEVTATDLDPDTTYVFNAVAETDAETATGRDTTFTTEEPPLAVETAGASAVGQRGATLQGELTETGGAGTVAATVEYWEAGSEVREETLARTLSAPGTFEIGVEDLAPETTYEFRALAETDRESAAGEASSFTTESLPLAVETGDVAGVGQREATLAGGVTELGAAETGEVFFEYWIDGEDEHRETEREPVTGAGAFERQITGLEPGTPYAFRAVAETSAESDAGEPVTFTTEYLPLTVETGEATAVGHTRATVTGELTELGAADTATVSVEYWESGADERRETTAEALSEPAAVETDLTYLLQDTAYAFRALADSGAESDAGSTAAFATPVEQVSRPTVDRTAAGEATFSQWGDGYRIRAAGKSPWQRPRDEHGYGAVYGETEGDVVVQTTLAGLRGEHDLRLAGLVVTNDILRGGGVAGDLLLAVEPAAGVSLAVYDDDRREYETVASAGTPVEAPVDLRLTRGDREFVAEYRRATDTDWQPVGSVAVPAAEATQHVGLFATSGHERTRCVADFAEFRIGETGVTLLPSAREISPDVETTLDLVVENADSGIRSYAVTIEVPDTDLLTVEDVTLTGEPGQQSVDIRPDGSRATVEAGMGGNPHGNGDVTIAEVTLHTGGEGTVAVELPEVVVVDDAASVPYDVASVEGAAFTIAEGVGPPPVVGDDPPRDLDGDGLFRDIDGDGEFTISDVQAFFDHRRDDVVLDNAQYFSFAGGDPPDVSLADVQALFEALIAEDPEAAAVAGLDGEDAADLRRALVEGD